MSRTAEQRRQEMWEARSKSTKQSTGKFIIPVLIFLLLSFSGWKEFINNGLQEQSTHEAMTELGLMNYKNSGVVWYGVYSYFNENPVTDLMYKTRDCRNIESRGAFYPGHNKYNYFKDTLDMYIGLWKPSRDELKFIEGFCDLIKYKNIKIYIRRKN